MAPIDPPKVPSEMLSIRVVLRMFNTRLGAGVVERLSDHTVAHRIVQQRVVRRSYGFGGTGGSRARALRLRGHDRDVEDHRGGEEGADGNCHGERLSARAR